MMGAIRAERAEERAIANQEAREKSLTAAQNMFADGLPRESVCRYLNITDPELTALLASPAPTKD